jgi:hypothetical protein
MAAIAPPSRGNWKVAAMNAGGSRPVDVRVNIGATLPALPWIAAALRAGGVRLVAAGVALIAFPLRQASRNTRAGSSGAAAPPASS